MKEYLLKCQCNSWKFSIERKLSLISYQHGNIAWCFLITWLAYGIGRGVLFWRFPSVGPNFVSALVLCNYWLEFSKTLLEPSIPRGDAHVIALFRSDTLTQKYGPLISYTIYNQSNNRAIIVCKYCLEFNESLWEPSIPIEDAHIFALFGSDPLS
jgi:hypothetical protein